MGPLDSAAALRRAIRRLITATRSNTAEVTIQRRDLELIIAVAAVKLQGQSVPPPNLHPQQR